MNLNRLRMLSEIAGRGSFRAAAIALDYSPSAISQQIALLEREAGVRLVQRGPRGAELTDAGRLLVRVRDAGSGIDPQGIRFRVDGGAWRTGRLSADGKTAILSVAGVRPGRHALVVRIADRQEAKNDENVAAILPNTRELRATIRVR